VQLVISARDTLATHGIRARVVSMPSHELFAAQDQRYRDEVLTPGVPRVAIEAGHPMSWYRWVGDRGAIIGLDHFGASAPAERLFREFGITAEHVVSEARRLVGA
jgi:transketolase